jgi:hypothetical protein
VLLLLGVGFGAAMPALTALAMSDATPGDAGLASGLFNTTQQVGGALGLAVLATLATARTSRLLAGGEPAASALTGGYHLAFAIAAGFVAAAATLAATLPHRPAIAGPAAGSPAPPRLSGHRTAGGPRTAQRRPRGGPGSS